MLNIALLEFQDEAERFVEYCRDARVPVDQFHIVALSPAVQAWLHMRGLRYSNTLPYFRNDSHDRIVLKSEEWLTLIEGSPALDDGTDIKDGYQATLVFYLRMYANYFLWILEVLKGLADQHHIACLTVCADPSGGATSGRPALDSGDRFLPEIVKRFAAAHEIPCVEIPYARKAAISKRPLSAILKRCDDIVLGWLAQWHLRKARALPQGATILVSTLGYNLDYLLEVLRQQFPSTNPVLLSGNVSTSVQLLYWMLRRRQVEAFLPLGALAKQATPDSRATERMAQSLRNVKGMWGGEWQRCFVQYGVGFTDVFTSKVERDLFKYLRSLVDKSRSIRNILSELTPVLVISPFSVGLDALLGELSGRLSIRSLSISHGTSVPPRCLADEIEGYRLGTSLILTSYGYTALQSPWAEKYVEHFKRKCKPTPIRTGSLILARVSRTERVATRDRVFGLKDESEKVIVYATTLKPRSSLRFQLHETLDEHLAGIADLTQAITAIQGARLIVKLHPGGALKEQEVTCLVPEANSDKVRIITKLPFNQVLSAADLVVSYSSTCIEEAIQNGIPVLLYDPWNRYQHLPALRWGEDPPKSQPAYYVNDSKLLDAALRWILRNHDPRAITEEQWSAHVYPDEVRGEFFQFVADSLQPRFSPTQVVQA